MSRNVFVHLGWALQTRIAHLLAYRELMLDNLTRLQVELEKLRCELERAQHLVAGPPREPQLAPVDADGK